MRTEILPHNAAAIILLLVFWLIMCIGCADAHFDIKHMFLSDVSLEASSPQAQSIIIIGKIRKNTKKPQKI